MSRGQFQVQPQAMRSEVTSGHLGAGTEALPAGERQGHIREWRRLGGGAEAAPGLGQRTGKTSEATGRTLASDFSTLEVLKQKTSNFCLTVFVFRNRSHIAQASPNLLCGQR